MARISLGLAPLRQHYAISGTGSPEGVVTANVGVIYLRTDGPPSRYVKDSGVGNTGWVAK